MRGNPLMTMNLTPLNYSSVKFSKSNCKNSAPSFRSELPEIAQNTILDRMLSLAEGGKKVPMKDQILAAKICLDLFREILRVNPAHSDIGIVTMIRTLRENGISGSRICKLFNDVAKGDITTTLKLIEAKKLGLISKKTLLSAIDHGTGLDLDVVLAKLNKHKLKLKPDFETAIVRVKPGKPRNEVYYPLS